MWCFINTNNDLLLKLINDILDISRIESGQMAFVIKPTSVATMMDSIHKTFMVQMPGHLKFRYEHPGHDAIVRADELRLRQVLTNSRVESITDESLESNCSMIEKIPPKGVSFSDLIATFAMSVGFDTYFDLQH